MSKINRNQPGQEKGPRKLRILVAPLDWGLGHATRCIPIIYELLAQNAAVWLAAEGAQKQLLQLEFPDLPILPLEGYRVKYSRRKGGMIIRLLRQIPKIVRSIKNEEKWLREKMAQSHTDNPGLDDDYAFDAIISDNRYGLHHSRVPCVFITHQLKIKAPAGNWVERFLRRRNYRYINKFNECWVPDLPGAENYAGDLSHPDQLPDVPVKYVGLLSRFNGVDATSIKPIPRHLFISLSGPEPQRSMLENKIINEISHYNGTATIVRGLPGHAALIPSTNDIRFYNHLETGQYLQAMLEAEVVVCRGGYSTIMDLLSLRKKAVLIPTPGQTEQEYLCEHLKKMGYAGYLKQEEFTLAAALKVAGEFEYKATVETGNLLAGVIREWLLRIQEKE